MWDSLRNMVYFEDKHVYTISPSNTLQFMKSSVDLIFPPREASKTLNRKKEFRKQWIIF